MTWEFSMLTAGLTTRPKLRSLPVIVAQIAVITQQKFVLQMTRIFSLVVSQVFFQFGVDTGHATSKSVVPKSFGIPWFIDSTQLYYLLCQI
mmetsp:Transcript_8503/g.13714  ORF Transcript_8503/g.13714 Transcript_8503/m.13714 type:complete len:91 (-) Transcript_8503:62-334(-)